MAYLLLVVPTLLFCYKLKIKFYNRILFGLIFYISSYTLTTYSGYLFFKFKYTVTDNFGYSSFSDFLSFISFHFELVISSGVVILSILLFKRISKEFIIGIPSIILFIGCAIAGKIILKAMSLDCTNQILANILLFTSNIFVIILFAICIVTIQFIRNKKASK